MVSIPQIGEICIRCNIVTFEKEISLRFNPLDRGNLYQMLRSNQLSMKVALLSLFQSPRSGKFVSDIFLRRIYNENISKIVSIPQIGEICIRSDPDEKGFMEEDFVSIPQIGEICIRLGGRTYPIWFVGGFNPLDRGNLYQI